MPEGKSPDPKERLLREADEDIRQAVSNFAQENTKYVSGPNINQEEEKFAGEKFINGIDIRVFWSYISDKYMIFLPQIVNNEIKLLDSNIYLSKNPEEAQMVFDKICSFAETEKDVNDFYDRVKTFLNTLPFTFGEREGE